MKEELARIPVFGAYTSKAGMIHVDREGKTAALRALAERARQEIAKDRQIVMFPEGTRRPPGAPPDYQTGIALLYKTLGVPVMPAALNSGLYWPRRKLTHHPGTIILEFLPPIPAGLDSRSFLARLESTIEAATDRLMAEAAKADPALPLSGRSRGAAGGNKPGEDSFLSELHDMDCARVNDVLRLFSWSPWFRLSSRIARRRSRKRRASATASIIFAAARAGATCSRGERRGAGGLPQRRGDACRAGALRAALPPARW